MNWEDLNNENNYKSFKVYAQSKLCNILYTRELAKRLEGTKVTINAVHPGVVLTELNRYVGETFGWIATVFLVCFYPIILLVFKTVKHGAQTSIYCALSPDLNNVSGRYFADCAEQKTSKHAMNDEDAKRLWEVSQNIVDSFTRKSKIIN